MRRIITVLCLLLSPAAGFAQDPAYTTALREADLPYDVVDRLEAILSDPGTLKRRGATRIESGEVVQGRLAVVEGSIDIAGRIEGDLLVIGGDVRFEAGGEVTGDVTVVCGAAPAAAVGGIGGTLTVYDPAFCDGGRYEKRRPRRRTRWGRDDRFDPGRATFTVRPGTSYNRVEGLPLMFGPVLETGGANPLRLEALAVWRTESSLSRDEIGYSARVEQFLGGRREFRLGATLRSLVAPIESAGVSDLEASLSTVLFHSDPRDHFEREGWSAYARWTPAALPVDATLEYRNEEHRTAVAADPWSLFDGDDRWRAQPLVAEGTLRSLAGELRVDTRDDEDDPTRGWLIAVTGRTGLDGSLVVPGGEFVIAGGADAPVRIDPRPVDADFSTAVLDVRRYQRVGWGSLLGLRAAVGGAVGDRTLPPQFQHALGGIGTLPGYDLFDADCGARRAFGQAAGVDDAAAFHPAYGCDRFALFQAELIGDFGLDFEFFERRDDRPDLHGAWTWDIDFDPAWVVFFDAGRGWLADDAAVPGRADTGTLADVGLGFLLGDLGLYAAVPLQGDEREVNVFLRLGRRF